MALLNDAVEEKKLDTRVVERNLDRGRLSADELAKAIKNLPDDVENASWVTVESLDAEEGEGRANGHADASVQH